MSYSFTYPPQLRRSDYAKLKATQDELLQLRISNDANIANARKMQNLGTPLKMDPRQEMSAAELLLDEGQQESNARINLEKLFRPQEANDIISAIRIDPALDYSMLNVNFPSIEADIKRRFNIKLITASFFIEYFKKYSENLAGAVGMKIFQGDSGSKINGMVNNVSEIRQLLPDPNAILFLERAARNSGIASANVLRSLNNLSLMMPTPVQLDNLSKLDPVTQQQLINAILIQTQNIPSQTDINALVQNVNKMSQADLLKEIGDIVNGIPANTTNLIVDYYSQMTAGKKRSTSPPNTPIQTVMSPLMQATPIVFSGDPLNKSQVSSYLTLVGKITQIVLLKNGNKVDFDKVIFKPTTLMKNPIKIYVEDTNINDLLDIPLAKASATKTGSGFTKNDFYNEPKIKLKVGRGLTVKEEPTFVQFGKYVIHMPMLMHHDMLNLKYKSLGPIPKFKNHVQVSDIFKEFLLDIIATGKINKHMYNEIDPDEKKLFEDISIGSGLWNSFNLKKTTNNDDEIESNRFEILRGQILAGNNNIPLITEFRKLVLKFINNGKIRKCEGLNLLMQLN